ncbi:uncharacterized protein LOC143768133 [Ranitomeya variabilis]|uniref:uncharacterized protein LOC143768133 n=1 Tax=Ranitomeya variabilis TaxID=490064 RepID=UPI004056A28C
MEQVLANIAKICADFTFEANQLAVIVRDKEEESMRILRQRRKRRLWIHPITAQRMTRGVYSTLYLELRENPQKFFNYVRMKAENFEILLGHVEDSIRRRDTQMRFSISPAERLMVTIRFLATGESFSSLHFQFRLMQQSYYKLRA